MNAATATVKADVPQQETRSILVPLVLVYDLRGMEFVGLERPPTLFEEALGSLILAERPSGQAKRQPSGYVGIGGCVTGMWAKDLDDGNWHQYVSQVVAEFQPRIAKVIRTRRDEADARTEPVPFHREMDVAWARLFFDLKLERIQEKVNNYADSVKALERGRATVPKDIPYEEQAKEAARRSHAFRQQLAADLAPALNARIREKDMPHDTLDQKKELARWVNDQLEPLGLAVQCPKTGHPAKLWGITGKYPFCFEIQRDGKRIKTAYSATLPELTLMDAAPPKAAEVSWQQKVSTKNAHSGQVHL